MMCELFSLFNHDNALWSGYNLSQAWNLGKMDCKGLNLIKWLFHFQVLPQDCSYTWVKLSHSLLCEGWWELGVSSGGSVQTCSSAEERKVGPQRTGALGGIQTLCRDTDPVTTVCETFRDLTSPFKHKEWLLQWKQKAPVDQLLAC